MAFDDFKELSPSIILSDGDTSTEDVYNRIEIKDGSEATPEIFNEGIMDSLNRDINLETALTYLARSAALYTTSTSKFLSHCEGNGIDIITNTAPSFEDEGTSPSTVFIPDSTFIGAAFPQGRLENMVYWHPQSAVGSIYVSYPRSTLGTTQTHTDQYGWTCTADGGSFSYKTLDNASEEYTDVTNEQDVSSATYTPGSVKLISKPFFLLVTKKGSSAATPVDTLSLGVALKTVDDLSDTKSTFTLRIRFFDASGNEIQDTAGQWYTVLANVNTFNSTIHIDGIKVPTQQGASTAQFEMVFDFKYKPSHLVVSKIMVHSGDTYTGYVPKESTSSNCQYTATALNNYLVNLKTDETKGTDTGTILFWSKFRKGPVAELTESYMGPLFLSFGNEVEGKALLTLGPAHWKEDSASYIVRLTANTGGTAPEEMPTASITIPTDYFDKYLLWALRFKPSATDTTKIYVELAVVVENKVLKCAREFSKSLFGDMHGSLLLGRDTPNNKPAFKSYCGSFNGPVTEIRYDLEWVNDLELYVLSLAKKPYTYKLDTTSQLTTKEKSATEVLDEAGINLVPNPTGRYALTSWTQKTTSGTALTAYTVLHTDPSLGNCFKYIKQDPSVASIDYILYTDKIELPTSGTSGSGGSSSLYSIRAIMQATAAQGPVGTCGIGVRWLNDGDTFVPTVPDKETSSDILLEVDDSGTPKYYRGSSYSGTAKYAVVYIYVKHGAAVQSLKVSKIKFEKGEPTYFTEDSGADYALYY